MVTLLSRFFCGLIFSLIVAYSYAETNFNGAASYTDLGTEVFIASLYLDNISDDANEILASEQPKKIQLHLVNRMSKRRWVNMWMQSIAINNSRDHFEQQAEQLVALFDKFQGSLQTGDIFEISYQPGSGTTVSLNGTQLFEGETDGVLQLFLKAWLGPVPPSTDYKKMILGTLDSTELKVRTEAIKPSSARVSAVKEWAISEEEKLEQERIAKEQAELKQQQLEAQIQAQAQAEEQEKQAALKAAAEEKAEAERLAAEEQARLEEEKEEELTLSVESILAQQEYTAYVIKAIYQNIRYPNSAVRKNHQGTVRLNITILKDGSINERNISESSGHTSLDKAALKALDRAAPLNGFPEAITDESQTFTIPIAFKLSS